MKINPAKLDLAMAKECLSTSGLQDAANVSIDSLSKIRRGLQNPKPITIGKLARALGVPVEYLLEEV